MIEHIKGASYWKFNNSLVNDKDIISQMKIKIPEFYKKATELLNPNARCRCWVFPSGVDWGDPPSRLCSLHQGLVPPQKFPENNRENNILLFSNNSLLLKIPPLVNLLGKTLRWDNVKYQIRKCSLKISKDKAKQRKAKRIGLESRIKELESSISTNPDSALD